MYSSIICNLYVVVKRAIDKELAIDVSNYNIFKAVRAPPDSRMRRIASFFPGGMSVLAIVSMSAATSFSLATYLSAMAASLERGCAEMNFEPSLYVILEAKHEAMAFLMYWSGTFSCT